MQFGVCGNPDMAAVAARAGYDYAEWNVTALLKPREPEAAFLAGLEAVKKAQLPYPVVNCFVNDLKITGPEADMAKLRSYVVTVMERAERAGVEVIVFGSGGARRIPEGFAPDAAREQLVDFCRMAGALAGDHGVTVVVEPLNKKACNVLNTVDECARLVEDVGHARIRLLVDAYHMMCDGDACADVARHGRLLAHVHIATVPNRLAPGGEACDFTPFFAALAQARYTGRISIEGKIPNPETDLPAGIATMRKYAQPGT